MEGATQECAGSRSYLEWMKDRSIPEYRNRYHSPFIFFFFIGLVATNLGRNFDKVIQGTMHMLAISPKKGALTSVYLAASPDVEGVTKGYFYKRKVEEPSKRS